MPAKQYRVLPRAYIHISRREVYKPGDVVTLEDDVAEKHRHKLDPVKPTKGDKANVPGKS